MTGQQLKNSILQEAIQGRLVPNVLQPGEKTGAELLQDILAARQKKENDEKGKKAKKLTISTIDEEPWDLPEGWCWCSIGDIFEHSAGKSLNSSKQSIGRIYQYLTTSNVYWEGINFDKVKEMAFTEEEYKKCSAIKDDILVCEGGDVGRSCIWTYDYTIGLQNHVHRLRAIKNTNVQFFCYVIRYYKSVGIITAKGIGIGGFSANALKGLSIPLPPLSIQKAIVEKIEKLFPLVDEYDNAAGELEALNEALPDKLRKSVLQEAIHGTLVPNDLPKGEATAAELLQQILKERQDKENKEKGKKAKRLTLSTIEDEPWELPEGWCWCLLRDLCAVKGGKRIPAGRRLSDIDTGYKYIRVSDMKNGSVITTDLKYVPIDIVESIKRYTISKDDLYITVAGTIGDVGMIPKELDGANLTENADKLVFTILDKRWLYWFLKSPFINQQIRDVTTKVGQPKLAINKIEELVIPLPPLSVQHRIVEKIEEVFSAIDKLDT